MSRVVRDLLFRLRRNGVAPRAHGNGFIQLPVTSGQRLHFWGHPEAPRARTRMPIHDHVFDLHSEILQGRLFSVTYAVDEDPAEDAATHQVYQVVAGTGTADQFSTEGRFVSADAIHVRLAGAREIHTTYRHPRDIFHESFAPEPAVSLMTVTWAFPPNKPAAGTMPRVLVPLGYEPDQDFCRDDYPQELLWRLIDEIVAA